jgi:hypothetical protein
MLHFSHLFLGPPRVQAEKETEREQKKAEKEAEKERAKKEAEVSSNLCCCTELCLRLSGDWWLERRGQCPALPLQGSASQQCVLSAPAAGACKTERTAHFHCASTSADRPVAVMQTPKGQPVI